MKISTTLFVLLVLNVSFGQQNQIKKITNIKDMYPYWMPDGSGFVFQSNRTGNWEIFYMNQNGKEIKQLTSNGFKNTCPFTFKTLRQESKCSF